jgi:hypothetical protein
METAMVAYQISVNIKGVQVTIPFDTLEELETRLSAIDIGRLEQLLVTRLGESVLGAPKSKPGFEGLYAKGPDGLPQLLKAPKSEIQAVALSLFAAEPRHLSSGEITKVSGVKEAGRKYLSSGSYKRLFLRDQEGNYGLSHEGRKLVINTIVPTLMPKEGT